MSLQEVDVVGVSHADAVPSRLRAPCSRDKATIPVAGNMEWSVGVLEDGPATISARKGKFPCLLIVRRLKSFQLLGAKLQSLH